MLAICFAVLAVFEWSQIKSKSSRSKKTFWWFFSIMVVWNIAANVIPWWPNPNQIIMFFLGWIKSN
ncbi:hypothetical protein [Paenibacillus pini]|uniref:hypothetical protein n=1 Tax=Paenibacillus pini TaxID=669461 RepID=UPI00056A4A03|nr:hypothetical protein [Paenibacillus pini]